MLGSGAAAGVAVCDTAGLHSKTVDKTAAADGATKLDDNLMTLSSHAGRNAVPVSARYHKFRIGPPRVERISADD
jgi:hypothetical protein